MKRVVFAVAGALSLAGLTLVGVGALAQPEVVEVEQAAVIEACDTFNNIADRLGQQFKEVPAAFGLQVNGNLLQVFVAAETGSWTILSTAPSGMSCIVAAGESWETFPVTDSDPMA